MRKSLLIAAIIAVVVFSGFFAWYFLSKEPNQPLGEFIYDALPFGSGGEENIPFIPPEELGSENEPGENGEVAVGENEIVASSPLFKISETPVAGAVAFSRGGRQVVRYMERATGHIYEVILPSSTSTSNAEKTRITNTTIPKIYEAHFKSDGNAVLTRSLREDTDAIDNNFITILPRSSTSTSDTFNRINSNPLRGNTDSMAVAGTNIFFSLLDNSSISVSTFEGTGQKTVFTSPFTNWRLSSAGNSLIAYTKASAFAPGYAYTVNTTNGALTKIAGSFNGLVAITNPAGNRVAYSYIESGQTRTFVKNIPGTESVELSPATLAEKCIWSTQNVNELFCGVPENGVGGSQPDNWYKGIVSFSDRVWSFDTSSGIAEVISEPSKTADVEIDATDLKLTADENYLILTNKKDYSLWVLRLE